MSEITNRAPHFHLASHNICPCGDYMQVSALKSVLLSVKTISHAVIRLGSTHSLRNFSDLYSGSIYICLAATINKYPRSRRFGRLGCEECLSPNISSGESLIIIHCGIVPCGAYLQVSALKKDISNVSAMKIIYYPIIRLVSHSFIAPFHILVVAPKNSRASIII